MRKQKGKFIVLYGANNLGKTTQAELLVEALKKKGIEVKYLKYPIYDLKPTGPAINEALRVGREISDREFQELFAQNRRDFESELVKMLEEGLWVVAEDYKGTGIAWGLVDNISLEEMEAMNKGLLDEDLSMLLDGEERYVEGIEAGHRHEEGRDWVKARDVHRQLAKRYGWRVVNVNQSVEKVHEDVCEVVKTLLLKGRAF